MRSAEIVARAAMTFDLALATVRGDRQRVAAPALMYDTVDAAGWTLISDVPHPSSGGWIEVISGVMFSGKSEELIRRVRRAVIAKKRVQVFKSHLDARYAGIYQVSSHDGRAVEAVPVDTTEQIANRLERDTQVIGIDEAQFLDAAIVDLATSLAQRGLRLIIAGTDLDFRGEPFGPMPHLMAIAEQVDKLHAICVVCGGPASRNQRLIEGKPARYDSPTIMVGGHEAYEARCRSRHRVPRRDEDQVALL
jgi:thymidine kinase